MKTQYQMFYEAQSKIADADHHFMDLIKDPVNPLTNKDLIQLVARFPQRWERYAGYIGTLAN